MTAIRPLKNSTNVRTSVKPPATLAAVRMGLRVAEALPGDLAVAWAESLFTTPRRFERPEREHTLLASGRPFTFSAVAGASGAPLCGWRFGDPERPIVLLVHGWEGRGAQLGALVEPLLARGFQVITFDAPAHGDSPGHSAVLTDFARAIVAAARAAVTPSPLDAIAAAARGRDVPPAPRLHAIVAHSIGAAATTVAAAHYDLFAHGVPRLVYLAPPAQISRATTRFARRLGVSPHVLQGLNRRLERRTGLGLLELDGPYLARELSAPLLIVHDADDAEVPVEEGRRIAEAWPGARLELTAGLGHQRILWAPDVIRLVSQFVE
jgi:pimeloyl-ACP methyl ester carboxylesterase